MSNRKLMGALSILLLAALVMTIGCGDGTNKKREPIRKGNGANAVGGNPKDVKQKSQKIESIDGTMKAYTEEGGQAVSQQSIEAGTYELSEVMGYVRYDRNQDEIRAIGIGAVTNGSLGGTAELVGMMGKDSDSARTVEVPLSFTVSANSLNPVSQAIYSIQIGQVGVESKLIHGLSTGGASEISILKAISGTQGAGGAYMLTLMNGKKGEVHIRKLNGAIRISVMTEEMKKDEVVKNPKAPKNSSMIKRMAFTYRQTKAAQTAAVQTPPAKEAAPAAPAEAAPAKLPLESAQPTDYNLGIP